MSNADGLPSTRRRARRPRFNPHGRHVVVTGGSRGIGIHIAKAFAQAGAQVTLLARDTPTLRQTSESLGVGYLAADLRHPDGLGARLLDIAPVDVLIHNAGLDSVGTFTELSADQLADLYLVNALAPAELTRQLLPAMLERGCGQLVFVSSLSAHVTTPGLSAYAATKAAVSQLAHGLRTELRDTGITVTLAEIGTVQAGMFTSLQAYAPAAAALHRTTRTHALRLLAADEVATGLVRACAEHRETVVLPRRAQAQTIPAHLPQHIANLLIGRHRTP